MGKKGTWFSAVKKAFRSKITSKESSKKDQSKNGNQVSEQSAKTGSLGLATRTKNETNALAVAAAAAAEAAKVAAHAAAEVARLTGGITEARRSSYNGPIEQHSAAIKIQTAFRGYLARRTLRALRGLVRLRALVSGHTVRRQATRTLRCMQAWVRVQARVRARRIHMSEEAVLQRQMWQRIKQQEFLLANKTNCDDNQDLVMWDGSIQSFEKAQENQLLKREAMVKRERALAYAFTHQLWRSPSRGAEFPPMFIDLMNHGNGEKPRWGWSWLERWMATRPLESPQTFQLEKGYNTPNNNVMDIPKITTTHIPKHTNAVLHIRDDMVSTPHSFRNQLNMVNVEPPAYNSPRRTRSARILEEEMLSGASTARSSQSVFYYSSVVAPRIHSFNRRSSIEGSSLRDDESLLSSPSMPGYMAATHSARAKARSMSNPRQMRSYITGEGYKKEGIDVVSAKKRLYFPPLDDTNTQP